MKKVMVLLCACALMLMPACAGAGEDKEAKENPEAQVSEVYNANALQVIKACIDGQEFLVFRKPVYEGVAAVQVMESDCNGQQCSLRTKECKK